MSCAGVCDRCRPWHLSHGVTIGAGLRDGHIFSVYGVHTHNPHTVSLISRLVSFHIYLDLHRD